MAVPTKFPFLAFLFFAVLLCASAKFEVEINVPAEQQAHPDYAAHVEKINKAAEHANRQLKTLSHDVDHARSTGEIRPSIREGFGDKPDLDAIHAGVQTLKNSKVTITDISTDTDKEWKAKATGGVIHVNGKFLRMSPGMMGKTLVHEASHVHLGTKDYLTRVESHPDGTHSYVPIGKSQITSQPGIDKFTVRGYHRYRDDWEHIQEHASPSAHKLGEAWGIAAYAARWKDGKHNELTDQRRKADRKYKAEDPGGMEKVKDGLRGRYPPNSRPAVNIMPGTKPIRGSDGVIQQEAIRSRVPSQEVGQERGHSPASAAQHIPVQPHSSAPQPIPVHPPHSSAPQPIPAPPPHSSTPHPNAVASSSTAHTNQPPNDRRIRHTGRISIQRQGTDQQHLPPPVQPQSAHGTHQPPAAGPSTSVAHHPAPAAPHLDKPLPPLPPIPHSSVTSPNPNRHAHHESEYDPRVLQALSQLGANHHPPNHDTDSDSSHYSSSSRSSSPGPRPHSPSSGHSHPDHHEHGQHGLEHATTHSSSSPHSATHPSRPYPPPQRRHTLPLPASGSASSHPDHQEHGHHQSNHAAAHLGSSTHSTPVPSRPYPPPQRRHTMPSLPTHPDHHDHGHTHPPPPPQHGHAPSTAAHHTPPPPPVHPQTHAPTSHAGHKKR